MRNASIIPATVLALFLLLSAGSLTACSAQTSTPAQSPEESSAEVQSGQDETPGSQKLNMRGTRKTGTARTGPIDMLGTAGREDAPDVDPDTGSEGEKLPE